MLTAHTGLSVLLLDPLGWGRSPYLKTANVFFCPEDNQRAPNRTPAEGWYLASPTDFWMSYWYFYFPKDYYGGGWIDEVRGSDVLHRKNAAKIMIMIDQGYVPLEAFPPSLTYHRDPWPFFHGRGSPTKQGWNALYRDGHVKWVQRGEVEKFARQPVYYDKITSDPSGAYFWQAVIAGFDAAGG
jgi:hypothetical protein